MLTKHVFDFICAVIGLILLGPVFTIIAIMIRLDSPGPVFFLQQRIGRRGRPFRIVKFRTMVCGAESGGQITVGQDPRVTRIGRVLRRYKLDELPQLLNVARGEMSLVGPRPEVPRYIAYYPASLRSVVLSLRPGITDRASIEFREENAILARSSDPERSYVEEILPVKLDYYARYARERSFMLDLKIIFMTLLAIAGKPRAAARSGT